MHQRNSSQTSYVKSFYTYMQRNMLSFLNIYVELLS